MTQETHPRLDNNLEGRDGEGGGREVEVGGDTGTPMADSRGCSMEANKIM